MYAYDYEPPKSDGTKAVWIVDDDRSIRWVLEKALAREGIAYKTFSSAYEVLQALAITEATRATNPRAYRFRVTAGPF